MGLKLKIHLFKSILKAFLPNFDVFSIGRVIFNSQVDKLFLNLINDVLAIVFKLLLEFLVVEFCHYVNKTKNLLAAGFEVSFLSPNCYPLCQFWPASCFV